MKEELETQNISDEYNKIPSNEINRCRSIFSKIVAENPLLTKEEEFKLADQILHGKTKADKQLAREKLFNSNVRLVFTIAYSFRNKTSLEYDDLVSAGLNGLILAVDKFNPEKFSNRFSTYAYRWIKVYIDRYVRSFRTQVYVPMSILEKHGQYIKLQMEDGSITDKEIMKKLGITKMSLKKIKELNNIHDFSINVKISKENDDVSTFEDIISDENEIHADEIVADKVDSARNNEVLYESISELSSIQKDIIERRHLNDDIETLATIAERHNLTKERIRQIEFEALRKLKKKIQYKFALAV
jgi:RNA polymerase sigma factor (sigma-70 family)